MPNLTPGIGIFVSVRFSATASPEVHEALIGLVAKDKGLTATPPKDADFIAWFGQVTAALSFIRNLHTHLRRNVAGLSAAVGIECGEHSGKGKCIALERAVELCSFAHFEQNLVGRAAREIARTCMPVGYRTVLLGEANLGNSISKDQIFQLTISGFPDTFPYLPILDDVTTNIDKLAKDFIGRDREEREVRRKLLDSRVVTIVGPAGVGKTMLAHWLTLDLADDFRDGTWRVDLAKVPKGGNVAVAIAADLRLSGIQDQTALDRVRVEFATMDGLIWLDNCEHLLRECCDVIEPVLPECQNVRFLLTSRAPLDLPGESVVYLAPFETPSANDDPERSEAVRLFVNRARLANPNFKVDAESLNTIAKICTKVSGLPLAIELAAAQAERYSVKEILERLGEALKTPMPGVPARHRTLDNALGWSYSMLNAKEQKFFRSLGVVVGPINIDLACAVGGSRTDGESILKRLVSSSLIQESSQRGIKSYRLLEPVRQFAHDLLKKHAELEATISRFAKSCLDWLTEQEKAKLAKMPKLLWLVNVRQEYSNILAALEIFLDNLRGGKDALSVCALLYDLWILDGPYDIAFSYYERALATGKSTNVADTADIYCWAGLFAGYAGKYQQCESCFTKAIAMHLKAGRRDREAIALLNMTIHLRNAGKFEAALEAMEKCMSIHVDNDPNLVSKYGAYAWILAEVEQYQKSREYLERAILESSEDLDPWIAATQQAQLHHLALVDNKTSEAEAHLAASLALYRESGHMQGILVTIEHAGILALRLGDAERAARLIGGSERHLISVGVGRPQCDLDKQVEAVAGIKESLGDENATEFFKDGALMSIEELYDYARAGCG